MIANARMYSVSPQAAALWRTLLFALIEHAGVDVHLVEHAECEPLEALWKRTDQAAVFMCGLPFSRAEPAPLLLAAPVPSPAEFHRLPQYWSELVVRKDSSMHSIEDTFGGRIALTVRDSQSGWLAALYFLMSRSGEFPLYREVIAPRVTPLGALSAVVDGAADVAPIDSYAFCLLQKYRQDLTCQVRTVARTEPTPIPPLVTSSGLESLRAAFLEAHRIAAIAPLMAGLLLERFVIPNANSYAALRSNYQTAVQYWRRHELARTIHPAFVK